MARFDNISKNKHENPQDQNEFHDFYDDDRVASMADEGGVSAAILERHELRRAMPISSRRLDFLSALKRGNPLKSGLTAGIALVSGVIVVGVAVKLYQNRSKPLIG